MKNFYVLGKILFHESKNRKEFSPRFSPVRKPQRERLLKISYSIPHVSVNKNVETRFLMPISIFKSIIVRHEKYDRKVIFLVHEFFFAVKNFYF